MPEFTVEVIPAPSKDMVVLRPKGKIDSASTPILESRFNAAMQERRYHVVIDLANTELITSTGVGLLLGTAATLRQHDGDLILLNIPEQVQEMFEIMCIDAYFRTIDSLEDLVAANAAQSREDSDGDE